MSSSEQRSAVPDLVSARAIVGGVVQSDTFYTGTAGLLENQDETIRQALQFDAGMVATGSYGYAMRLTNHFGISLPARGKMLYMTGMVLAALPGWKHRF